MKSGSHGDEISADRQGIPPGGSSAQLRVVTSLLALCLGFFGCAQLFESLSWGHGNWQMSEWLINYQGGFVRRGLSGELVRVASIASGIQANHLVIVFSFLAYIILVVFFLKVASRVFDPAFLLSGMVLAFPAMQAGIVRKDCLLLLCFIASLRGLSGARDRWRGWLLASFSSCVAVLVHEAYALFALPALLLTNDRQHEFQWRRFFVRLSILSPVLACFLFTTLRHGDAEVAQKVNDSWIELWEVTDPGSALVSRPSGGIQALGWSKEEGLSPGLNLLTSGLYQPLAWAMIFAFSGLLMLSFVKRPARVGETERPSMANTAAIMGMQFAAITPLFVLGHDYGRWLFFWIGSTIITVSMGWRPPARVSAVCEALIGSQVIQKALTKCRRNPWIMICFGVPVCWNIHEFLRASPLGGLVTFLRGML